MSEKVLKKLLTSLCLLAFSYDVHENLGVRVHPIRHIKYKHCNNFQLSQKLWNKVSSKRL